MDTHIDYYKYSGYIITVCYGFYVALSVEALPPSASQRKGRYLKMFGFD